MIRNPTIRRALELYGKKIGVPVRSLTLTGEIPLSEEFRALRLCEREDALQAFLAGRQHFDSADRVLIERVLDLVWREAHDQFAEHVVPADAPR